MEFNPSLKIKLLSAVDTGSLIYWAIATDSASSVMAILPSSAP